MQTQNTEVWKCQYCGKDTSEVEYDYLSGYDHLGCALEQEIKSKAGTKEMCILCGEETPYTFDTHIDFRVGYVEGAGQLCKCCYDRGTERRLITVPANMIYNTPNDMELGGKVRQLYYEQNNS